MYDPTVGKFLSEDPLGFPARDANLARYVGNNAPNLTDPTGLMPNRDVRSHSIH
jgi:RHS repeat-associated protein